MNSQRPLNEAELFQKDDLEFRTITILLHALDSREKITLENCKVQPNERSRLKLLAALSSLLVRDHEILAVLLRRSATGTTVFLSSEEEVDISDDSSSMPSNNFTALNPEFCDPMNIVQLLDNPVINVGTDIGQFLQRNWDLSFESHVQTFANLLNTCLKAPSDNDARLAISVYSTFQSAPKVCRRLNRSPILDTLARVGTNYPTGQLEPSRADRTKIELVLLLNENGPRLHSALDTYLYTANCTPTEARLDLSVFHHFFLWFLGIVCQEINFLQKLRKRVRPPKDFPHDKITLAYKNLASMRYFAWESRLFASYIGSEWIQAVWENAIATGPAGEGEEEINRKASEQQEDEDDYRLDISTEYETGEDQTSSTATRPAVHPCILELRLITSNIQHIMTLLRQSPTSSFDLQVIQYGRSDGRAKPWRDLIHQLFPEKQVRDLVLEALLSEPGRRFDIFRSAEPIPKFLGQAHCVAVLGCLYSLATRGGDIAWTGIPHSLLKAISTCYSVLAPSKRCCPVCAMIISLLSTEGLCNGGRHIHALSKHSVIFPCALPIGLPRSIRDKLLPFYRIKLKESLLLLISLKDIKSSRSAQSETFSQDGEESEHVTEEDHEEMRKLYSSGWEELIAEQRRARWERGRLSLALVQQQLWWDEMPDRFKVGLTPPVIA